MNVAHSRSGVPFIAIAGRIAPHADNVRGPAYAAGQMYANAIARAGGQALILPPTGIGLDRISAVLARCDGVVLHGGGDIDPRRYGQTADSDALYGIITEHDDLEFAVLAAALERDLPVLAICRGLQVLNVHLGGTLLQDLGDERHWHAHHDVELRGKSRLATAFQEPSTIQRCHSVHHQAIDRIGDGLDVTATNGDVIEAVELPAARWVVGVQWHPEDTAADDPVQQRLFNEFIAQTAAV